MSSEIVDDHLGFHIISGTLGVIDSVNIGPGYVILSESRYNLLLEAYRAKIVADTLIDKEMSSIEQ